RDGLVQRLVGPHQVIEIGAIVSAQPRPEDQQVVACDYVGRIEPKVAKMRDRLRDRATARTWRSIEELRVDREAARIRERELVYAAIPFYATGTCGCFSGARSRKFTMSSSDSGDSYDSMRPASASFAISGS